MKRQTVTTFALTLTTITEDCIVGIALKCLYAANGSRPAWSTGTTGDKERGKAEKTEKKPSIRAQLKADKEKTAQKKAAKSKNHELEV